MTQFNSETNQLDLYTDCRFLCGLETGDGGGTPDTTSYPVKAFTRNANFAMDKVISYIFKADGSWEFDDTNNTDTPIGVANLVSGQQSYSIPITDLKINRVRISDSQGNWIALTQVNRQDLSDYDLNAPAGDPKKYDLIGNSIYLYPAPSYSYTGGLEMEIQRGASYFAYTDTTKTPGFASDFHRLISMYAALDFCLINGLSDRAANLANMIGTPPDLDNNQAGSGMVKELIDHYSRRDADMRTTLKPVNEDYGQLGLAPGTGIYPTSNNPRGF